MDRVYGGTTYDFLLGPSGAPIAEYQATVPSRFTGGLFTYANNTTYFNRTDHLGTPRLTTDYTGAVQRTEGVLMGPFGDGFSETASPFVDFTGFAGGVWDAENNADHFGAREYAKTQGRWMSPDPAGLAAVDPTNPQSWNRYAYVGNNPVSFVDPTGMNKQGPGGGGDCNSDVMNCAGGAGTGYSGSGGSSWGFNQGTDMNGFSWSSGVGDFGGSGNPYGLPSGAGALQAGVSRYLSIMRTGWDPALGIQYYEYSFTGGDGSTLERQKELAAIQLGQLACAGQDPSAVAACIQDAYNTLYLKTPVGEEGPLVGGNYNFDMAQVVIPGADISGLGGRYGVLDSLHFHSDGTFHVDTANPLFIPFGSAIHFVADLVGGNTWWRGGIPRFP